MGVDDHAEPLVGDGLASTTVESSLSAAASRRRLFHAGLTSYGVTLAVLVANVAAGIIAARALGPSGRGVSVAVVMVTLLAGQLASVGATPSLSYHAARESENAARLYGTWAALAIPLALLAIGLGELMLPVLFSAQSAHALHIARLFLPLLVLVLWLQRNNGMLLGLHDFTAYNVLRFVQPGVSAIASAILWQLGYLTVESSLAVWAGTQLLAVAGGTLRLRSRVGIARPDLALARRTLSFGIRAHGDSLAGTLNTRLDLVILPAYVAASGLGLYSVAANVSLIINQLATSLSVLVLPSAARDQRRGPRTVVVSLQATLLLAGVCALALFAGAEVALGIIYGDAFRDATATLRLLLPGTVLYAGSTVLAAGLHGAGHPLRATLGQFAGAAVTVVGLMVFVPLGGITAAAAVSTAAYATVFAANLRSYRRITGLGWREFLRAPRRARMLWAARRSSG